MMPMNSPCVGSTLWYAKRLERNDARRPVLCSNLTGTMYPMYSTFKALEARTEADNKTDKKKNTPNKKPKDDDLNKWACYWAVFSCFRCIENFSDPLLFW